MRTKQSPLSYTTAEALAAARRSRIVARLKIGLPALAVALALLLTFMPRVMPLDLDDAATPPSNSAFLPGAQTLVRALYQGVDSSGRPYAISADSAEERQPDSQIVFLSNPQAELLQTRDGAVTLRADAGVFQQKEQTLALLGNVALRRDDGYELRTEAMTIDFASASVHSATETFGEGPSGTLRSEGIRIIDKGKIIALSGRAHLMLRANALPSAPKNAPIPAKAPQNP